MLRCLRIQRNGFLLTQTVKVYASGWKSLQNQESLRGMFTFYPVIPLKRTTIRIRKVRSRDIPNVIGFLQDSFGSNEPLVESLQMPTTKYSPALEEFWRNSIDFGMSFIAVPSKITSKNILGAVINTQICPWDPHLMVKFSSCILCPKTKDLINLWAFFFKDSEIFERYNKSKIFNIAHVIVNENNTKGFCSQLTSHKLASILVEKSIRFANSKDFDMACLICTGDFLANVAKNVGMNLFWKHSYKQLLNEKLEPVLKNEGPNKGVKFFIQDLKNKETINQQ